jgi:hypothetical protein
MKKIKSFLFLFSLSLILMSSNCNKKLQEKMNSWMGSTKNEVIQSWGLPNNTASDGDGGEVLVFSESSYYQGTTYYRHVLMYFNQEGRAYHWLIKRSATPPQQLDLNVRFK